MNFRKFLFSSAFFLLSTPGITGEFSGTIIEVHDGDTLTLRSGKEQIRIRLYGIDCPELKQEMGEEAKKFTSVLCNGKDVKISTGKSNDRYKRTIGIVSTQGKVLNIELLKAGLAWHYKQYSRDKNFADAEQEAIDKKIGIWQTQKPQAPWEYRKARRNNHTHYGTAANTAIHPSE